MHVISSSWRIRSRCLIVFCFVFLWRVDGELAPGRTMFLCRAGRLSAATLDQALKSAGSILVQVEANRLRHVTLTLRKQHALQGHRCFCVPVGETRAHLRKQRQPDRDSSSGLAITGWAQLDRVVAVAASLSKSARSQAGSSDLIGQTLVHRNLRGGGPGGHVLFTGTGGVSSRRCSTTTTTTTRTMHTRAAAAKKSSDAGEEQAADGNKEVNYTTRVFVWPRSSTRVRVCVHAAQPVCVCVSVWVAPGLN